MGRMEGQIADEVKQARVEELMLAQQEVAFAKAKAMVGQTIEVLIDRPAGRDEEDGYVARTQIAGAGHRLGRVRPRRRTCTRGNWWT